MSAYRSILIPLDGSSYAAQALPLAELFGRTCGATVHFVMGREPVQAFFPPELPIAPLTFEGDLRQRDREYLEGLKGRFEANSGLCAKIHLVEGDIPESIAEVVEAEAVDLVIMTTHGHSGLSRLLLGSNADKLIRKLSVPVLVVHPAPDRRIVPAQVHRILVPLDGSRLSASILDEVKEVAGLFHAQVLLGMVVEPIPPMVPPVPYPLGLPPVNEETRALHDQRYLDAAQQRLEENGISVETAVVLGTKVSRRIVELAERRRCDLIMMATHGAGGIDRLFLGSVTDQVVRRAGVPVFVARPREEVLAVRPAEELEETSVAGV